MHKNLNKIEDHSTPGPWSCTKRIGNNTNGWDVYDSSRERLIASMDGKYMEPEWNKANAYLISAAPEMRDFIADFLDAMDKGHDHLISEMIPRAEEILKKVYNF